MSNIVFVALQFYFKALRIPSWSMCVINNYLMLFSATTRAEISPSVMFYENSEQKKNRIVLNDILIAFRIIFESYCYNVYAIYLTRLHTNDCCI